MLLTEIFITCWLVLLANGAVHCYCEGETPPEPEEIVLTVEETRHPREPLTAP